MLGASIGFLLFGLFFVRKLYNSGEYTISGAIAQKYGRSTMLTVSLIMIYALLLVNVGNYISGAAAIATVLKINLPIAMCIIAVVSTFYYVFGGLKGVAYVTVLHSTIKLIGVAVILGVALYATGGISPMAASLPPHYFTWDGSIGASTIIAWTIGTIGAIFSTQFIMQAISSAPNANAGPALDLVLGGAVLSARHRAGADRRLRQVPASHHEQPLCAAGVPAEHEPAGRRTGHDVARRVRVREREHGRAGDRLARHARLLRAALPAGAGRRNSGRPG